MIRARKEKLRASNPSGIPQNEVSGSTCSTTVAISFFSDDGRVCVCSMESIGEKLSEHAHEKLHSSRAAHRGDMASARDPNSSARSFWRHLDTLP